MIEIPLVLLSGADYSLNVEHDALFLELQIPRANSSGATKMRWSRPAKDGRKDQIKSAKDGRQD